MTDEQNSRDLRLAFERINGIKESFGIRIEAVEKATNVAKDELNRRLETMNEFREQLNRQARTFVTTPDLKRLEERLDHYEKLQDRYSGESKWTGYLITSLVSAGIAGLVTAIVFGLK